MGVLQLLTLSLSTLLAPTAVALHQGASDAAVAVDPSAPDVSAAAAGRSLLQGKCRKDFFLCRSDGDCCSGNCALFWFGFGRRTRLGFCVPDVCRPSSSRCRRDDQCCSQLCSGRRCRRCRDEGRRCRVNKQCCSGRCDKRECMAGCNAALNQIQEGSKCVCNEGFINVSDDNDNPFCVPICGLTGSACTKSAQCCDSGFYNCQDGACKASSNCKLGSNIQTADDGSCECIDGFQDVDDAEGTFCVPECVFPENKCSGSERCCGAVDRVTQPCPASGVCPSPTLAFGAKTANGAETANGEVAGVEGSGPTPINPLL